MKSFKIKIEVTARTSVHRWVPDKHRRGGAMKNKKAYNRKGRKKASSDPFAVYSMRFIHI